MRMCLVSPRTEQGVGARGTEMLMGSQAKESAGAHHCLRSIQMSFVFVFSFQTDENSWKAEAEIDMELFHQVSALWCAWGTVLLLLLDVFFEN